MSPVTPRDARPPAKPPATEKPDLIVDREYLPATARKVCLPARFGDLSRHRVEQEFHA
jgi:hypothetical protein